MSLYFLKSSHPEKFYPWILTFEVSQTSKGLDRISLDNESIDFAPLQTTLLSFL
jgi:hypothetical protein